MPAFAVPPRRPRRQRREARRLIKGGGAKLNNAPIAEETQAITHADLDAGGMLKLSAGKRHAIVRARYR